MNMLLTAIGKRVQLIKHLKDQFSIIGTDSGELVPASNFVNKFYKIPKFKEKYYLESLLKICKDEKIDILIPLYELEFKILSENRQKFQKLGTTLLLSNSKIINICNDKYNTYEFFKDNMKCPKVYYKQDIEYIIKENRKKVLPLIVKPKSGMGSKEVFKVNSLEQLEFFKDYVNHPIIQQYIDGKEYTVDVLCDLNGRPIYIVPRIRLEVRAGEVSKSSTIHDRDIINAVWKVVDKLNTINMNGIKVIGPLTVQFFKTSNNEVYLLEINSRFGGGVPLSFKAGANYAEVLKRILNGDNLEYKEEFKEITMLRFDDAIYI